MLTYTVFIMLLIVSAKGVSVFERGKQMLSQWYLTLSKYIPSLFSKGPFVFDVENHVRFLLYTRSNPENYYQIVCKENKTMEDSYFDRGKKTKILIHGWWNAADNYFSYQLKDAYLQTHDFNIINVDWSKFSNSIFYPYARIAVNYIGPYVANLIDYLVEDIGVSPKDIHILGHSLGAHIAGLAGENANCNVSRITGMDPAGPLFLKEDQKQLDSNDAQFVDIIHTSVNYLGVAKAVGHADFYPNGGGPLQPGCGVEIGVCTHRRSYRYFIESLSNEKGFMSKKCNSWTDFQAHNCSTETAFMGEIASPKIRGKFYLRTSPTSPFALGEILR